MAIPQAVAPDPPPTLTGIFTAIHAWLRRHVVQAAIFACIGAAAGAAINFLLMVFWYQDANVDSGSAAIGQGNLGPGSVFWLLANTVVFGLAGYWWSVGTKKFAADLRGLPASLRGLLLKGGAAARVHLCWGAATAFIVSAVISPAIGGVVAVALIASLPSVVGRFVSSLLFRAWSSIVGLFSPRRRRPLDGAIMMAVGILGSIAALAVVAMVTSPNVKLVLAGACAVAAVGLSGLLRRGRTAAVVLALGGIGGAAAWPLSQAPVAAQEPSRPDLANRTQAEIDIQDKLLRELQTLLARVGDGPSVEPIHSGEDWPFLFAAHGRAGVRTRAVPGVPGTDYRVWVELERFQQLDPQSGGGGLTAVSEWNSFQARLDSYRAGPQAARTPGTAWTQRTDWSSPGDAGNLFVVRASAPNGAAYEHDHAVFRKDRWIAAVYGDPQAVATLVPEVAALIDALEKELEGARRASEEATDDRGAAAVWDTLYGSMARYRRGPQGADYLFDYIRRHGPAQAAWVSAGKYQAPGTAWSERAWQPPGEAGHYFIALNKKVSLGAGPGGLQRSRPDEYFSYHHAIFRRGHWIAKVFSGPEAVQIMLPRVVDLIDRMESRLGARPSPARESEVQAALLDELTRALADLPRRDHPSFPGSGQSPTERAEPMYRPQSQPLIVLHARGKGGQVPLVWQTSPEVDIEIPVARINFPVMLDVVVELERFRGVSVLDTRWSPDNPWFRQILMLTLLAAIPAGIGGLLGVSLGGSLGQRPRSHAWWEDPPQPPLPFSDLPGVPDSGPDIGDVPEVPGRVPYDSDHYNGLAQMLADNIADPDHYARLMALAEEAGRSGTIKLDDLAAVERRHQVLADRRSAAIDADRAAAERAWRERVARERQDAAADVARGENTVPTDEQALADAQNVSAEWGLVQNILDQMPEGPYRDVLINTLKDRVPLDDSGLPAQPLDPGVWQTITRLRDASQPVPTALDVALQFKADYEQGVDEDKAGIREMIKRGAVAANDVRTFTNDFVDMLMTGDPRFWEEHGEEAQRVGDFLNDFTDGVKQDLNIAWDVAQDEEFYSDMARDTADLSVTLVDEAREAVTDPIGWNLKMNQRVAQAAPAVGEFLWEMSGIPDLIEASDPHKPIDERLGLGLIGAAKLVGAVDLAVGAARLAGGAGAAETAATLGDDLVRGTGRSLADDVAGLADDGAGRGAAPRSTGELNDAITRKQNQVEAIRRRGTTEYPGDLAGTAEGRRLARDLDTAEDTLRRLKIERQQLEVNQIRRRLDDEYPGDLRDTAEGRRMARVLEKSEAELRGLTGQPEPPLYPRVTPSNEEAARYLAGMPERNIRHIQSVADRLGVEVHVRPTGVRARQMLESGDAVSKPEWLKMTTVNADDVALGASENGMGQVGYFKPKLPDGITDARQLPDHLRTRFLDRLREFDEQGLEVARLRDARSVNRAAGERPIELRDGIVYDARSGKPFTSDHDLFDIRGVGGREVPDAVRRRVIADLERPPANVQHPEQMNWKYSDLSRETPPRTIEPGTGRVVERRSDHAIAKDIDERIIKRHRPDGTAPEPLITFRPDERPGFSQYRGGIERPELRQEIIAGGREAELSTGPRIPVRPTELQRSLSRLGLPEEQFARMSPDEVRAWMRTRAGGDAVVEAGTGADAAGAGARGRGRGGDMMDDLADDAGGGANIKKRMRPEPEELTRQRTEQVGRMGRASDPATPPTERIRDSLADRMGYKTLFEDSKGKVHPGYRGTVHDPRLPSYSREFHSGGDLVERPYVQPRGNLHRGTFEESARGDFTGRQRPDYLQRQIQKHEVGHLQQMDRDLTQAAPGGPRRHLYDHGTGRVNKEGLFLNEAEMHMQDLDDLLRMRQNATEQIRRAPGDAGVQQRIDTLNDEIIRKTNKIQGLPKDPRYHVPGVDDLGRPHPFHDTWEAQRAADRMQREKEDVLAAIERLGRPRGGD